MDKGKTTIIERSVNYSLKIINLFRELEKDSAGKIIGKQLLHSATSIGANIHEAQGEQCKTEFILKMSIARKESLKSAYWLKLINESKIIEVKQFQELLEETEQLIKAVSSIITTSRKIKKPSCN